LKQILTGVLLPPAWQETIHQKMDALRQRNARRDGQEHVCQPFRSIGEGGTPPRHGCDQKWRKTLSR
jgi:hypothetical protein